MDDSVSRFWGKFTEKSRSYGITPENTQAYITHANQFILQADGKRLATHNAANIDNYLTDMFVEVVGSEWDLRAPLLIACVLWLCSLFRIRACF